MLVDAARSAHAMCGEPSLDLVDDTGERRMPLRLELRIDVVPVRAPRLLDECGALVRVDFVEHREISSPTRTVGELLRGWRTKRRLSQLDLSLEASVSSRHISYVETGRSKPSRELLLDLAEHLDVPLRERNALLLAGGFAPTFHETPLEDTAMASVRSALDEMLRAHEPFPALVVDLRWNLVKGNDVAMSLLTEGVAAELLAPPANALRLCLHPKGLAPRISNLDVYGGHLVHRLSRQVQATGDAALATLLGELEGYLGRDVGRISSHDAASKLFVPLRLSTVSGEALTFFSTVATFGTALDITLAELAIESFFPADAATYEAMHRRRTAD